MLLCPADPFTVSPAPFLDPPRAIKSYYQLLLILYTHKLANCSIFLGGAVKGMDAWLPDQAR